MAHKSIVRGPSRGQLGKGLATSQKLQVVGTGHYLEVLTSSLSSLPQEAKACALRKLSGNLVCHLGKNRVTQFAIALACSVEGDGSCDESLLSVIRQFVASWASAAGSELAEAVKAAAMSGETVAPNAPVSDRVVAARIGSAWRRAERSVAMSEACATSDLQELLDLMAYGRNASDDAEEETDFELDWLAAAHWRQLTVLVDERRVAELSCGDADGEKMLTISSLAATVDEKFARIAESHQAFTGGGPSSSSAAAAVPLSGDGRCILRNKVREAVKDVEGLHYESLLRARLQSDEPITLSLPRAVEMLTGPNVLASVRTTEACTLVQEGLGRWREQVLGDDDETRAALPRLRTALESLLSHAEAEVARGTLAKCVVSWAKAALRSLADAVDRQAMLDQAVARAMASQQHPPDALLTAACFQSADLSEWHPFAQYYIDCYRLMEATSHMEADYVRLGASPDHAWRMRLAQMLSSIWSLSGALFCGSTKLCDGSSAEPYGCIVPPSRPLTTLLLRGAYESDGDATVGCMQLARELLKIMVAAKIINDKRSILNPPVLPICECIAYDAAATWSLHVRLMPPAAVLPRAVGFVARVVYPGKQAKAQQLLMSASAWAGGQCNGPRRSQDEALSCAPSSRLQATREPTNLSTLTQVSGRWLHAGTFSTPPGRSHSDAPVQFTQPGLVLEASNDILSEAQVMAGNWSMPTPTPVHDLPRPIRFGPMPDPASYDAHTYGNTYIHTLRGGYLYLQTYGSRHGNAGLGVCLLTSHS